MKKLSISLIISFVFCLSGLGQGFVFFKPDGALTETLLKNGKDGANSVIETIVNEKVDIANLTVNYKLLSNCSLSKTPLTSNFTGVEYITVNKKNGDSKDWTLIVHQLKPATLPFELSFSKNKPCDLSFENPKPWAGYGIDYTKPTVIRFGNAGVGFFVAFEGEAKEVSFELVCVSDQAFNGEMDVEYSQDGSKWKKLITYTPEKPFKNGEKNTLALPSNARYVRWVYAVRERINVNLNNISIH